MAPGADGYNAKSCSCVNRIGKWYHDYATATVTTTSCLSAYDPYVATTAQQLGCVPQTVTELSEQYTAPADCCDKCGIVGSAVRLLYWPAQTPAPASASGAPANYANVTTPPIAAASSGIVSDGLTFVSPSVYVVYTSIHASASCVARVNSHIPLGPVHTLVTRAYAPEALSTAICQPDNLAAGLGYCIYPASRSLEAGDCFQGINVGWAAINYEELANPPPDSVIYERKRSCFPSKTGTMDPGFLKSIFLNPQLSFPSDVSEIDPMWKTWGGNTCTAADLGVVDPPSVLGQATALVPQGPVPAQPDQAAFNSDCGGRCLVGPGLHSSAAALVSTPTAAVAPGATAEPAVAGQSPASPNAQQTTAPAAINIPQQGAAQASPPQNVQPNPSSEPSGNNPIVATPQQASAVPNGAASSPNAAPAPAPAPAPAAITLQPQQPAAHQAVVPQDSPSVGQAVNGAINNTPVDVPANQPAPVNAPPNNQPGGSNSPAGQNAPANQPAPVNAPVNSPAPTDTVPLVAAVPSVDVGGQPVFQHPNSNIVVAGNTIPPGSTAQVGGHSVSNGISNVIVDGSTQAIPPSQPPVAAPAPLPTVGGQQIQQQGSNLVVAGQTIAPGQQGSVDGHAVVNNGNAVVVDGSSQPIQPTPAPVAMPSVNGQPIQTDQSGNLVVAGSTIAPGAQAVVQGHTVENQGSSFVLDGSTGSPQPTPVPQALPMVQNQPIQKQQNGNLIVAGSITVPPGVQTNIAGQQISNGPSQVEVNGQTFAAAPAQTAAPLLTDGGIVHMTNGALEVGSQTLIPGSQVTLSGHIVDYANPSQVVVDGTTHNFVPISSAQPLVIAGQTMDRASNGGVIIAGSTIAPNGVATVGGHTFSLAGSSSIVEDGNTYSIPPTSNAYVVQANTPAANGVALPTGAVTLANGLVVTPEAGAAPGASATYRLPGGVEISAGGAPAIVSGTTYSALPSGEGFLVNGKSTLALPEVTAGAMASAAVYTVGGQVFTANPTGFAIGSATVAPGGTAVTVSGTVISLDKSSHLRIGSSTMDLTSKYPVATNDVVSVGGSAITAAPTGFVVAGTTVSPGGSAVTINGTVLSLDKSSHLRIGSSTVLLTAAASATSTTASGGSSATPPPTPVGSAGTAGPLPTGTKGTKSGAGVQKATSGMGLLMIGAFIVTLIL